jgi:hypothetical protein
VLNASINLVQQRWAKPNRLKDSTSAIHIYEIRPRADAVIHVYDAAGNVIETHEHKADFKDW